MNKEELSHKIIDLLWDKRDSLKATYNKRVDSWEIYHELKIPLSGAYVVLEFTHPFRILSDKYLLVVDVPKHKKVMQRISMKKHRNKIRAIIDHYIERFNSTDCEALSEVVKILENIKSE